MQRHERWVMLTRHSQAAARRARILWWTAICLVCLLLLIGGSHLYFRHNREMPSVTLQASSAINVINGHQRADKLSQLTSEVPDYTLPANNDLPLKFDSKIIILFHKLKRSGSDTNFTEREYPLDGQAANASTTRTLFDCCGLIPNTTFVEDPELSASTGTLEGVFHCCSELQPSINNVFFLETSCAVDNSLKAPGNLTLTEMQTCAISSAASQNPSRKVILLFTCPIVPGFYDKTKDSVKTLFDLPNFFLGHVDVEYLYSDTHLLGLYHTLQQRHQNSMQHQSDILRYFILYNYGGTYIDLDTISLRSLDDLGVNYIGIESDTYVNPAVMNFEPKHQFLRVCLIETFHLRQPDVWGTFGPRMVTDLIRGCGDFWKREYSLFPLPPCNLTLLPMRIFYAVVWESFADFYRETTWPQVEMLLNESYIVHHWNSIASKRPHPQLRVGSKQPLVKLAERHCRQVLSTCGRMLS